MNRETIIEVPLVDQFKDTGDDYWAQRSCAICSLKMMMVFKDVDILSISVVELIKEGLGIGGYAFEYGWRHRALVDIASRHGIKIKFQEKFFYTPEEKEKGMAIIDQNIDNRLPVMVSIFRELNPENGGHIVVINGRNDEGYYIQDPDYRFRGNNYFLTKEEFKNGWRGGLLWFE